MQGRSAAFQEAGHGGIGTERLEELDGADESDTNALGFQGLGLGTGFPGDEFEESTALFDGVDGDRDVVDAAARVRNVSHRRMLHSA
jgi:hypothetical protein